MNFINDAIYDLGLIVLGGVFVVVFMGLFMVGYNSIAKIVSHFRRRSHD